jgi:hypothetical protein
MKLFFAFLSLCFTLSFAHAEPLSYQPVSYQTLAIGTRSGCDVAAKMVVTTEAEWQRVWNKHTAHDEIKMSAPPIDWTRKAVVVLLGGARHGSLEVQHIARTANATTIYYAASSDAADSAQPFHFALIDAPVGAVKFADGLIDCSACAQIRIK